MKKLSRWLIILLVLGFIFRIGIVFWSLQFRENTDVLRYKDAARISYLYGLADTYKPTHLTFGTLPNNQPPGSLYLLSATYNLELQTAKVIFKLTHTQPGNNLFVNGPLVDIFLRLPSIFADIILGAFIYLFIRKVATEKAALLGSSLFLFTPPVWYNSAFWGQMDALNNLMFFAALFFLYNQKFFRTVLFALLSLFIKFSLLPLMPIFFYILFQNKNLSKKNFVTITISCVLILVILTLPVSGTNIFWLTDFIKNNSLGEMQFITNFAFNFWWLIFHPAIVSGSPHSLFSFSEVKLVNAPLDSTFFLFLPLIIWAFGLFIVFCIPLIKKINNLKEKILTPQNIILIFCLASMLSFCFLPRMHERYLYPLFPLLATLVGLTSKYFKTFIIFSLLNFLNLYLVWHPMTLWFLPYNVINNAIFQWIISLSIVITILTFYFQTIRFGFMYGKRK